MIIFEFHVIREMIKGLGDRVEINGSDGLGGNRVKMYIDKMKMSDVLSRVLEAILELSSFDCTFLRIKSP